MAVCNLAFNFEGDILGGSGPYKTGFDCSVPLAGDMPAVLSDVSAWWEAKTAMRALLDVAMGAPLLTLVGEFAGSMIEESLQTSSAPTGTQPDLPGVSLRAVKIGARPRGGRRGSMYWPGLSAGANGTDGIIDAPDVTVWNLALGDLITAVEGAAAGVYIGQRHIVDGVETFTPVTDFAVQPTVTFMNRRYR